MTNKWLSGLIAILFMFAMSGVAQAAEISWTDWTAGVVGTSGSGTGTISPGGPTISVGYTGEVRSIQTSGGTNWWTEGTPAPYTGNAVIDNAPPASDIITVQDAGITNTLTFSTPVVNPVMALISIGRPGAPVGYLFDVPFTLLSEGTGAFGDGSWTQTGDTLTGQEAHGAIQFNGTFSSISWTNDSAETWHGFTIGIAASAPIPEPSTMTLDHFKCYKATGDAVDVIVDLQDQSGMEPDVFIGKPKRFCSPVDKNGEGISHPMAHLTCYKIKGQEEARDVVIENQFGRQVLEIGKPKILCVPSEKLDDILKEEDDEN